MALLTMGAGNAASLREADSKGELKTVDLSRVFQLCLFGPDFELRWERCDGSKGRLTLSADDAGAALPAKKLTKWSGRSLAGRTVSWRDHIYLLWGKPSKGAAPVGWTRLTSARIGALWVPFADSKRLVLTAREYFATGEMGNVAFIGERLTGFRAARDDDAELAGVQQ